MSDDTSSRFEVSDEDLKQKNNGDAAAIPVLDRIKRRDAGENVGLPVCVIVVGMAGSGKTTLMAQLQRSLETPSGEGEAFQEETGEAEKDKEAESSSKHEDGHGEGNSSKVGYCLNLDPATMLVPYGASIDIRDTVDYKQVMKKHGLGPNGAIMTSLNLFATKFDQVIQILERRGYGENPVDYILVDTPGQIEAFTWSASGSIMSEALASSFPTVLAFVVDTPRCSSSPNTFMSNMLYACSMLYRTRLPLVVVFNKIDVVPHDFAVEWMQDYEAFQEALDEMNMQDDGSGFYGSLTRSLSLVLDEFYSNLHKCGVSASTGDGIYEFWHTVQVAAKDYETEYLADLNNRLQEQEAKKRAKARVSLRRLQKDVAGDDQGSKQMSLKN